MTISGILTSAAASLAKIGVETPRLDAGLLLAHILRTTRSALLAHDGEAVNAEECAAYGEAIGRRAAGESVAVITGRKEFRYLDFIVSRDTLVPRPETETLVEAALEKIAMKGAASVLDLGTGSGAVGLSIKHEAPTAVVTLSDISDAALDIVRKNSEKHRLAVTIVRSDLFANITGTFDIIVSNPPYVPSDEIAVLQKEVQNEPRLALDGGKDGLELIQRIICDTQAHLNDGGSLMMEADQRQMAPITEMLLGHRYRHITVLKDIAGNDRIITAAKP